MAQTCLQGLIGEGRMEDPTGTLILLSWYGASHGHASERTVPSHGDLFSTGASETGLDP